MLQYGDGEGRRRGKADVDGSLKRVMTSSEGLGRFGMGL